MIYAAHSPFVVLVRRNYMARLQMNIKCCPLVFCDDVCVTRMSDLAVVSEERPDRNTEVGVQHVEVQRDKVANK